MFNFMKKRNIQIVNTAKNYDNYVVDNNAKNDVDRFANMSPEEYMIEVEGGIIPYWADEVLMEKTGIRNLFASGAHVVNNLSYDDAFDCLKRAARMVYMSEYVCEQFNARAQQFDALSSVDAFANHLEDVKAGKTQSHFSVKHDFFSADTIRDLFIEARQNARAYELDVPKDATEAIERTNSYIKTFASVKLCTFIAIKCGAKLMMADMQGFKK